MIHHIGVFASDHARSRRFYRAALEPLDIVIGHEAAGVSEFWHREAVTPSLSLEDARDRCTTELHIAFAAEDRDAVDAFFRNGLAAGGIERHAPRYWPDHRAYCAFLGDPDGNNVEAVCKEPRKVGSRIPSREGAVRTASHAVVTGDRVELRSVTVDDLDALTAIFDEPAVTRWWGRRSRDDLEARVSGGPDEVVRLAVTLEENVVGMIQYEETTDPDYREAGIDVALGTAWHGRGLGREAVGALARHLIEVRGHHRLTIDPAVDNAVAIRCYEAVGFTSVGVMRAYERRDDGRWHDGLLMELLAVDIGLVPASQPRHHV